MQRTFFQNVARNKPEWLVQGILAHALEVEPALRRFLLRKAGLTAMEKRAETTPVIRAERKVGRWRADIVLLWPDDLELRLELKLCAGLTEAQRKTLKRHRALVIHPHGNKPLGIRDHPCVSWTEIARPEFIRDAVVRRLLRDANASGTWQVEALSKADVRKDFGEFITKKARGEWGRMWAFLGTIDERLLQRAPEEYRPGSWAMSRKESPPYYGWWFKLRGQRRDWFWFGFEGPADAPRFGLTYHRSIADWTRLPIGLSGRLAADSTAARILRLAREQVRRNAGVRARAA